MKIVYRVGAVLFTLAVFLMIGSVAVLCPAISKGFYSSQFLKENGKNDTVLENVRYQSKYIEDEKAKEYISNLTDEQLMNLMMHTIKYCLYLEDDLNITVEGEYLEIFRPDELSHMADVKGVFGGGLLIVFVAIIIFVVTLALGLIKKKGYYENCRKIPYYTIIGVMILLGFIGLAVAIDFGKAFDVFHKILFDDNWRFSNGVMIAMIGLSKIFLDLVPIILTIWISLLLLFVIGVKLYNGYLSRKFR